MAVFPVFKQSEVFIEGLLSLIVVRQCNKISEEMFSGNQICVFKPS